ncbi:hypothetical protein LCGC14_1144860 [marine sediment metagenome]|uniref:Uncharacterized protein n=1 Tax=marine sediment metagenome TaxID=412755 RepID=A0A0F9M1Z4_9ZZZZ
MKLSFDYEEFMDQGQQLSAELDLMLESHPDDEELKETQEFLADRHATLCLLLDA